MVAQEGDEANGEHDGSKKQEEDVKFAHSLPRITLKHITSNCTNQLISAKKGYLNKQ